jgi:HK97 gp10 family phage protein
MYFSITLTGGAELEKKLKELEPKVAKKLLRQTLRDGQKCIASKIKSNAKSTVQGEMGQLISKNVIVRAAKKQKKGSYRYLSMLRGGINDFIHVTKKGVRYYIPSAIEYGHALPYRSSGSKKSNKNNTVKDVPAMPFMRPAFDSTKDNVVKIIEKGIRTAVEGN